MLSAFGRAFRTPDLRRKLLFTLGIITIFRLGAFIPSPGVSYQNVQQCLSERSDLGRDLPARQPVQRRCIAAGLHLRPRHHAVHHGEHHRPAAPGGHSPLPAAVRGGRLGPVQADPVHPLPHDRPRPAQRHDAGVAGPVRPAAAELPAADHPGRLHHHHDPDHHHADGRHRPDHVDGRARDREGRRQRHVAADLHVHCCGLPELARRDLEGAGSRARSSWSWSSAC